MRKQGASIFVYLIFCLLIAIFVINFRPGQSRNDDNGCRGTSNVVVSVDGTESTQTAFKIAYSSPYNWGTSKSKVYIALETLIRRELLANEADKRGLIVSEDLVMDEIKKGAFFSATPVPTGGAPGQEAQIDQIYRPIRKVIQGVFDQNGFWNVKQFKGWVGNLNVSQNAYIEEQRRSMLASMMADILQESVQVSREEAFTQFRHDNDTATYDVVAFKPETYRSALRLTEADVDRFIKEHGDEISARYKADERTYKSTKPALKLRQIWIAKLEAPKPADKPADDKKTDDKKPADDKKADDKKPDDKKVADKKADDKKPATKAVGMPIEEAKAKLEAVRTAGKAKFAEAAKELNTDDNAKAAAGDIGWHSVENAALGDKALNDAVKALKPGELTPVVTTDRGAFLILAEDKREGDLKYEQVQRELAWEMAKDTWSKEAAKRAALNALNGAHGLQLDALYPKEGPSTPGGMDLEQLLESPNLTDDQKAKIRQMMLQQQGGQHGSLEVPQHDIPAGWFETQEAAGSAAPAPSPAPAGSAAPATGSAAPTGAGSAAAPATPPAPAPAADITPSKDVLPAMQEVPKAHVSRFSDNSRGKQVSGLGQSKEAIAAVFDELQPGELAKRVYEAEGGYIVVQLVERKKPDTKEFDKDADRRVAELRDERAKAFLDSWLKERCETLAKANAIKPNAELLIERDDQGKVLPVAYRPCMLFH
jgi:parvulin-like peptidyl-prolyl isomerase